MDKAIYDHIIKVIEAEGRESFPYEEIAKLFGLNSQQYQNLAKKAGGYKLRSCLTKQTIFFYKI
jgi:DNA-directed RNA polymerase specialized sigma24 family protein